MMKIPYLMVLLLLSLGLSAYGQVDTPESKKVNKYKVIYSDKKASQLNKKFSTKTISPQVLDKVMAHQQNQRIAAKMADQPNVVELKIVDFGGELEYTTETVSMKVIQSPKSSFQTKANDVEKIVVEKVISARDGERADATTINKYSKVQEREETAEKK